MRPRRLWAMALFSLAAVGVVWGCETPLEPDYVLDRARVLALRTEPVTLAPDASTAIDALLYLPPGSPTPTYEWTWCAELNSDFSCAVTAAALQTALDPDGGLGIHLDYALGSSAVAVFDYPATAAAIRAACQSFAGPTATDAGDAGEDAGDAGDAGASTTTAGDGGVRLTCANGAVTLNLLLTATVGGTKLRATRTVTVYYDAPDASSVNPTVDDLGLFAAPFSDASDVPDAVSSAAVSAGELGLLALVPASASELYSQDRAPTPASTAADDAGGSGDGGDGGDLDAAVRDAGATTATGASAGPSTYESLSGAWYVTGGRLASATTTLPAAAADASRDWAGFQENRWSATAGTYTVIFVVRDGRGGVGWLTKTFAVGGAK